MPQYMVVPRNKRRSQYHIPLRTQMVRVDSFHRGRAARAGLTIGPTDIDEMVTTLLKQRWCVYCPADIRERFSMDHIIPIKKGGGHTRENIQFLCPRCNRRKRTKLTIPSFPKVTYLDTGRARRYW